MEMAIDSFWIEGKLKGGGQLSWEKAKKEASYIPKDTLIIIGNGFDI